MSSRASISQTSKAKIEAGHGPTVCWDEYCNQAEFDEDFANTFCKNEEDSDLMIGRLCKATFPIKNNQEEFTIRRSPCNLEDLNRFAAEPDPFQIFCIRAKSSYSRLYISQGMFEQLLSAYSIFTGIWEFLAPFGFKTRDLDTGQTCFKFQNICNGHFGGINGSSFECAYSFRYVERNYRHEALSGNPDYELWSVRQCAVYQQYNSEKNKIVFVLITPSEIARKKLEWAASSYRERETPLDPFDLHQVFISSLRRNWDQYLRSIEQFLTLLSDRITLTRVQNEAQRHPGLTDFAVSFVDRQRLKITEDKILDMVIIFESLCSTLSQLQRQCQARCLCNLCDCKCSMVIDEFEEQKHEVQLNIKKTAILHKKAQATGQLLSDLLNYQNAQIAQANERSLNGLMKEAKEENSQIRILSEQSTKDAAAVKILTVITLIYLPVTVVASIFSSQLIHVDDSGRISMISESWWFAVIAGPLTIFTFLLWRFWLTYTVRMDKHKRRDELHTKILPADFNGWSDPTKEKTKAWMRNCLSLLQNRQDSHSRSGIP